MAKIFIPIELAQFTANSIKDMLKDPKTLGTGMGKINLDRVDGGIIISDERPDAETIERLQDYHRNLIDGLAEDRKNKQEAKS